MSQEPAALASPVPVVTPPGKGVGKGVGRRLVEHLRFSQLAHFIRRQPERFAQDILGLSDGEYGAVLAASGVGGIVGSAVAHRIERLVGPGRLLLGSMTGMGLSALAIATTSSPVVVAVAFGLDGFLIANWNVVVVSLRQLLTPDEMRGRVASVARTVAFGAIPIGGAIGGVLADTVGIRAPYYLAAAVLIVAVPLMAMVVSNSKIAALRAEAGDSA